MDQWHKQESTSLLSKQVGVPYIVVFLNKEDRLDEEDKERC